MNKKTVHKDLGRDSRVKKNI